VINGKLYSVSDDGTMRIWRLDAETLQQPLTMDGDDDVDTRPLSCPSQIETTASSPLPSAQPQLHREVTTVSCV